MGFCTWDVSQLQRGDFSCDKCYSVCVWGMRRQRQIPIRFHRQPGERAQFLFLPTGRAWKLQSGFGLWIICLHLQKLELSFAAAIVARWDKRKGRTHSLQLCIQDTGKSSTTEQKEPRDMWNCDGIRLAVYFPNTPAPGLIDWRQHSDRADRSSTCPLHSAFTQIRHECFDGGEILVLIG